METDLENDKIVTVLPRYALPSEVLAGLQEGLVHSILIDKKSHMEYVNAKRFTDDKQCRYFSKYKGKRAPSCGCRPCLALYLFNQAASGKEVRLLS